MKIERTKNSLLGIITGFVNKFVLLILPFFVKSIFINSLGMDYLGLNSLFVSLLNILNLAELGFSSAISFSMYKSIANNNKDEICSLLNLFKKMYNCIGLIIFVLGIILLPFIPLLCKNDIPANINIYIIYLLYLLNTAISYLMYAYKSSILTSHQKNYVINNINTIVNILLNIFQIVVIVVFKNYYLFVLLLLLSTIIYNIMISIYASKKYPEYIARGEIDKSEKNAIYKKVKALFFYRIGGVVLSSVDSVVISHYLGLTMLGKYNSYYYVITALFGFFQIFSNALLGGVGNSLVSESIEKNQKDFFRLNFFLSWIVCFCSTCLLCLYQPFIKLWVGEENMFSFGVVICLCVYFYVWKMMEIINLYKDAAGLWEYDKYRPIVAATFNLILNIILVQIIGIYGIVISTIISIIFIIFPWSSYILFNKYFKSGFKVFLKDYFINFLVTIIVGICTYFVCSFFKDYNFLNFIFRLIICIIMPNILLFLIYGKTKKFDDLCNWLFSKIKLQKILTIIKKAVSMLKYIYIVLILFTFIIIFLFIKNHNNEKAYVETIPKITFSIDNAIISSKF